ncbi:nitrous oxide reductase [Usnea florida]
MIYTLPIGPLLPLALAWIGAVKAVLVPGCQTVAPPEKNLTSVRTAEVSVPAFPFGVVYAQQNDIAFVALNTSLGVLNTSAFIPSLIHEIPLPVSDLSLSGATGIALTHNGRYVLVTTFSTTVLVVDVAKAVVGNVDAVVGVLNGTAAAGHSAIEVTLTRDDKYAFVSQEDGSQQTGERGTIEVFELHKPTANGTISGTYVGYLVLGDLVVGTALSYDGRILYATSETTPNSTTQGTLSVIDVEKLKTNPSKALITNADAGCGPVRVIVSRDDKTVWVTARESNSLLAFDAAKLLSFQRGITYLRAGRHFTRRPEVRGEERESYRHGRFESLCGLGSRCVW